VLLIDPEVLRDDRGFFVETYQRERFAEQGVRDEFVQDNHSRSRRYVLRGIHLQDQTAPMAKLIRCTIGAVQDVTVDLRVGSPTFGKWIMVELTQENFRELLVPVGFGHAFLTTSEWAEVQYKSTGYYAPAAERIVRWNDPELAIDWPVKDPIVSARDARGDSLREYARNPAFWYQGTKVHPRP